MHTVIGIVGYLIKPNSWWKCLLCNWLSCCWDICGALKCRAQWRHVSLCWQVGASILAADIAFPPWRCVWCCSEGNRPTLWHEIGREIQKGYLLPLQMSLWPALPSPSDDEPDTLELCETLSPCCCTCVCRHPQARLIVFWRKHCYISFIVWLQLLWSRSSYLASLWLFCVLLCLF